MIILKLTLIDRENNQHLSALCRSSVDYKLEVVSSSGVPEPPLQTNTADSSLITAAVCFVDFPVSKRAFTPSLSNPALEIARVHQVFLHYPIQLKKRISSQIKRQATTVTTPGLYGQYEALGYHVPCKQLVLGPEDEVDDGTVRTLPQFIL